MLSTRPARLHSVPPALSRGYQVPLALALIGSGLLARHLLARVRRIEVESFEEREEERRQRRIHETPRALLGVDFGSSEVRFATPIVETDQYGLDTVKRVRVLESKSGRHASPAYVAVDEEGAMLVGVAAKTHSLVHGGGSSVFALPSLVGRTSLPSDELSALQRSGVDIDQGPPLRVRLRGKPFAPESLFRVVLKEQKAAAAALLGAKALDGALTVAAVPPSFDDAQRVAITAAYAHAGLHVAALLDTPIAAARTYSHTRAGTDRSGGETLLVYDAGVRPSAAVVQRTRADEWEIVAHVVSSPLAAHAPDRLLAASAAAAFQKETGVDVMADPLARARFLEAVEQARIDLSTSKQTTINLPYIAAGPLHMVHPINRAAFEHLAEPFWAEQEALVKHAMRLAGDRPIHEVLFCGGMARAPKLVERVEGTARAPSAGLAAPEDIVVMGCAIEAARLSSI